MDTDTFWRPPNVVFAHPNDLANIISTADKADHSVSLNAADPSHRLVPQPRAVDVQLAKEALSTHQ